MKCPYNSSKKSVTQSSTDSGEDGRKGYQIITQTETYTFSECFMKECAAWKDGCIFNIESGHMFDSERDEE